MTNKMKPQTKKLVFTEKDVAFIITFCALFGLLIGCALAISHYINELKACTGA